jgi:DNA-binding Xre family transcriptional regulator
MTNDRTPQLRQLMQQVGVSSFKALSRVADVSEKQVRRLRRGELDQMRWSTLLKLSQALQIPVTQLVAALTQTESEPPAEQPDAQPDRALAELRQEYDRLQTQLTQQKQELWQEFQQSSLQILESLLLQLPTAAYAAQQNPQAPAVKLLPLLRPIDRLLQEWGIEQIAPVGAEIAYDPQQQQLMEGTAAVGDRVRVTHTGYRQGDRLLYRLKVKPIL